MRESAEMPPGSARRLGNGVKEKIKAGGVALGMTVRRSSATP